MGKYRLKVLELNVKENILTISLKIKCPYISRVKNPNVAIIFSNGVENRRLPMLVQSYFPNEGLDTSIISARYNYKLPYLFLNNPINNKISFWIEFAYGETVIEQMPFIISRDVDMSQFETLEKNTVLLYETFDTGWQKRAGIRGVRIVRNFVKWLWNLILGVISILLIPIFLLEGILALLKCVEMVPENPKKGIMKLAYHVIWRINKFTNKKHGKFQLKNKILHVSFRICSKMKIRQNQVVFISNRRNDLTGNFEFVHDILKEDKSLNLVFHLDTNQLKDMSIRNVWLFGCYCATSKVILIDDFIAQIYKMPRRNGTTLIQLWHACGAFKTFGFSRLGKKSGPKQIYTTHRNYDYAIVSAQKIAKFYAEGFGISLEKVKATGIPRTDIFFDAVYKEKVRKDFYGQYPNLKDKKILLFAPTFRGDGKMSGYYPVNKFNVVRMYEELKGEYAIIVKHHPFVRNRNVIPEEYKDNILDLSEHSELNDLLFVTDLLVTDYSSVIFEAALLDIPMLFYVYDLEDYIATRGFYCEFDYFVPGKMVRSFGQLAEAVRMQDFEIEKIGEFKTKFFDDLDGKSAERTVDLIYEVLKK